MNRWKLYNLLKQTTQGSGLDPADIQEIEQMDAQELREGVVEYLLAMGRRERAC